MKILNSKIPFNGHPLIVDNLFITNVYSNYQYSVPECFAWPMEYRIILSDVDIITIEILYEE